MPSPTTTAEFLDLLRKSGLFAADSFDTTLAAAGPLPDDPVKAAAALVRQKTLTQFQAKLLLAGKHRGFRLGPYSVRDLLGQGGMGAVYLADHQALRRRVAVKVLTPQGGMTPAAVERFLREARAAAALDHPNIVRIHDVGRQGELHFLVMEYVEGQPLDRVLDRGGPMACGRAVELVSQAAAGLQHAYEKGFIHRDIKPANLMLTTDGVLKILDMGLARSFETPDKLTEVFDKGAIVGTADYIAPEQAINSPHQDIRVDIYSLGATFFTLVTGRAPFQGNTTQKLLQHQVASAPSLTSLDRTIPAGLSAVIAKMLAKKPEERYATPADVIEALVPWLSAAPNVVAGLSRTNLGNSSALQSKLAEAAVSSTALPETTPEKPEPPRKKPNPALWVAVGVVGMLLVGGAAFALLSALGGGTAKPTTNTAPVTASVSPPTDTGVQTPPTTKATAPTPTPPTAKATPAPKPPPASSVAVTPASVKLAPAPKLDGVVYHQTLDGREKYAVKGTVLGDPSKAGTKWTQASVSGKGSFPPGWQPSATTDGAAYDGAVDEVAGSTAIGTRSGGTPATLLTPELTFPSGQGTLRVEYLTEDATAPVAVRLRPTKPAAAAPRDAGELAPSNGTWATADLKLPLNSATAARVELIVVQDARVWVRALTATDPVRPTAKPLLRLDLSKQEPFVQRTIRFQEPGSNVPLKPVAEGGPGKMPAGWYRWIEYPDTVAEFFADGPAGGTALGIQTVSGPGGVQINTASFPAKASRVEVRVLYQTGVRSPGAVVRFKPEKGTITDAGTLPPTGGAWRLAAFDVDLRGAAKGLFELYNGAAGPDAAVRFREFAVYDGE